MAASSLLRVNMSHSPVALCVVVRISGKAVRVLVVALGANNAVLMSRQVAAEVMNNDVLMSRQYMYMNTHVML
jgi:hypothetical protein